MKKIVGVVLVWSLVVAGWGAAYRVLLYETPPVKTGAKLRLALDSFSGYCIFRTPEFKKKLADKGIDFEWVDDEAKYEKRLQTLKDGSTPLAVFTIDALIAQVGATKDGESPAAIVLLIDESRGADAMIAYRDGLKDLDALNNENAKIIFMEDTPSETLSRVVRSQFELPNFHPSKNPDPPKDPNDLLTKFQRTRPTEPKAFVLWEPYVSQALKDPKAHLLVDSSRFKGFIIDVLVVQKTFLQKNRDQVQTVARAYFEVLHDAQRSGMTDLVKADAGIVGEKMDRDAAERVARGIWWKNTVENYAHLKLLPPDQAKGLEPVEDMIRKITEVLKQTQDPDTPFRGVARADKLIDDDVLHGLYDLKPPLFLDSEEVHGDDFAPSIADWSGLQRVGSLAVPPIKFSRGKSKLPTEAEPLLKALAANLNEHWPQFYLRIEGNTSSVGDPEANKKLATERANAVRDFLVNTVAKHRIQAIAKEPGQGSEVQFVVLQKNK